MESHSFQKDARYLFLTFSVGITLQQQTAIRMSLLCLFSRGGSNHSLRVKFSHQSTTYNRAALSWPQSDTGDHPKPILRRGLRQDLVYSYKSWVNKFLIISFKSQNIVSWKVLRLASLQAGHPVWFYTLENHGYRKRGPDV